MENKKTLGPRIDSDNRILLRRKPIPQKGLRSLDASGLMELPEWVRKGELLEALQMSEAGYKMYKADGILPRAHKRPEGWRTHRQEPIDAVAKSRQRSCHCGGRRRWARRIRTWGNP